MSKIYQYSTIGALMSGYAAGDQKIKNVCTSSSIGLGCADNVNAEVTIFKGIPYTATAHKAVKPLETGGLVPFYQVTEFNHYQEYQVTSITLDNVLEKIKEHITPNNIFLAVCIIGTFSTVVFRRPTYSAKSRAVDELTQSQEVSEHTNVKGRLVGFLTPELFGRISVPGFHLHFLSDDEKLSGHVLSFSCESAILQFEEKSTIEITNPSSEDYKELPLDIQMLDSVINKVEKTKG